MRIQHNISALNAKRNLTANNSSVQKSLEKLSSGYRINRAGDDAAGLAISESMRAQIKGLSTAQKNANDGISMIQTFEGALTETHSMLNRMYELSQQASNGIYTDDQRDRIEDEMDALRTEIDRVANTADFNGTKILKDADKSVSLAIGDVTAGNDNFLTLELNASATTKGLSIEADNTKVDTVSHASESATAISAAINAVSEMRSKLGAAQNRLEHTISNLSVSEENITAAESRIRDVDMADEMMSYTKNNILVQAAQAMLAQANQVPQGVLQLLQ